MITATFGLRRVKELRIINLENLKTDKDSYIMIITQTDYQIYNVRRNWNNVSCFILKVLMLFDYRNNKEYQLSLSDGLVTLFNSAIACVNNTLFVGAQLDALQYIASKFNNE